MNAIGDGALRAFGIAVIAGVTVELIKLVALEPSFGSKARLSSAGWTDYAYDESAPTVAVGGQRCWTGSDGKIWVWKNDHQFVMPGLVPGIHAFVLVDGRDKPGHDDSQVTI